MRSVLIAGLDVPVSQFSFGTATLHRVGSKNTQTRLVECAAENGFTHFDTAPLYGFGLSETVLGLSALSQRHDITFATKVGIYPPGGCRQTRAEILGRKLAGKVFPNFSRAKVSWAVGRATASITLSLKRLRRQQIDIAWLHEPITAFIDTEEWRTFMAKEIDNGRIRKFGFAGENCRVESAIVEFNDPSLLIQTRVMDTPESQLHAPLLSRGVDFSYGYLGATTKSCVADRLLTAVASGWSKSIIVSSSQPQRLKFFSRISRGELNDCD